MITKGQLRKSRGWLSTPELPEVSMLEMERIRERKRAMGIGDSGSVCFHRKPESEPRKLMILEKVPARQPGLQLKDPETGHEDAPSPVSWSLE